METFVVKADQRLLARLVRAGAQGNAIRALLELISNSDDSYRRLQREGHEHDGIIEVLYGKDGRCGTFAVRDYAEGMSHDQMVTAFQNYGAATSGLKEGQSVTGFFGTGAKNALAGMTDGQIYSFKDDSYCALHIFLDGNALKGELKGPLPGNFHVRDEHGIQNNGTVAYFQADPEKGQRVPRFDTVHSELANHWRLRTIMMNKERKVLLVDLADRKRKRRLRYSPPGGEEIFNERLVVKTDTHGEYGVHLSVFRSESELQTTGDDRVGGILITDEFDVALDMSLFKYERDSFATHLYGYAVFDGFRNLLAREEPVLDEKRDGLNRNHPVCDAVTATLEDRLGLIIRDEAKRQKESASKIDDEERGRYRNAFKVLNEIAETEAEEVSNLGQEHTDTVEPPPEGLCIYPDSAHLTLGKRYTLEVRVDCNKYAPGTTIHVGASSQKLGILSKTEIVVPKSKKDRIFRRFVIVQGMEVGRATLSATIGENVQQATIHVEPEKEENEHLFTHGMIFRPETLTVRLNRPRKSLLRIYTKIVPDGTVITLSSDQESVHIEPAEIVVSDNAAKRHVAEYEVDVWGDEPNVDAMVVAECIEADALLEVKARAQEGRVGPKGSGMFNAEPHFDQDDPEPLQRTSYSRETGRITVYANFPSLRHYLGDRLQYRKTLAAQVLIADLIAERSFFEMARAKKRDVAISPEAFTERIQRDVQEYSRKHGERVHKALVDSTLFKKDRCKSGAENINAF